MNVSEHPLSDVSIAGDAVYPLSGTFHALLQTIADLMILLPMGSALQQIAVRCWGIRFNSSDHPFLHRSQVCNHNIVLFTSPLPASCIFILEKLESHLTALYLFLLLYLGI